MSTEIVANDENEILSRPLLTRSTYADKDIIEIDSSRAYQSDLIVNNGKIDDIHEIGFSRNKLKTMSISYEKINYSIDEIKVSEYCHKWQRIFSCSKTTTTKQILFNLSGIFTIGMNAILGRLYFSTYS